MHATFALGYNALLFMSRWQRGRAAMHVVRVRATGVIMALAAQSRVRLSAACRDGRCLFVRRLRNRAGGSLVVCE
jgi:hypothetical protein